MHAEDLILDFKSAAPAALKAAVACQEKTMPFFPSFLSLYATGLSIPGSLEEEDYNDDQGYSDEEEPRPSPISPGASYRGPPPSQEDKDKDMPPSPEAYNPTPLGSYAPSCLSTYDNNPYGGYRPPSDWLGQPIIPLSDIVPNIEPWRYP
jgi:hypothetical protein